MARGSLSSVSLDKYSCVALSGVAAEYLTFGRAEGGLGDIHQLDALLQAIGVSFRRAHLYAHINIAVADVMW